MFTAFDPATVAVLTAAYNKAIDGQPASAREGIAKRIIELAADGERDPDKLCSGALARYIKVRAGVMKYSVQREGDLWHWRVFGQRGVQLGHGTTHGRVLSRAQAINFASDLERIKDLERLDRRHFEVFERGPSRHS